MDYQELIKEMAAQKEEMTPSERMKNYCAGQEVDHLPYSLLGADPAMAEIFGFTTSQMDSDFEIMAEVIRRKRDVFGLEGLNVGLGLRTIGSALGSQLHFPKHGIDYVTKHVLTDYKEFSQLEITNPYKNPILSPLLETAKKLKDRFPDMDISTGVTGPLSTAAAVRPVESLLRDTIRNPKMLKELLDLTVACSLRWVEVFCKEFGSCGTGFSDPVTCMDIISKKQFESVSYPYMKKLVEGLEKLTGQRPSAHICGKTKPIWRDLKTIGLSAFSIDNCEDLKEAKIELGDTMMLVGNVPPVAVMHEGTIDDVINACKACIKKCGDNPMGFQLDTGCQVPLGTKKENMDALIYTVRKYGKDARIGIMPKGMMA